VVVAAAATVVAVVLTRSRPERTAAAPAAPNSVVAIDARTNRITGQTPVGARPGAIAFAADALWVGNRDDESISRIAGGTLRPQQTISAGGVPSSVVAAGGAVWVAVTSPTSGDISVRRIDVEFGSFDRTVRVSNVDAGSDAALASSAGTLWVAPFTGEVTRVDLASGRVLGQLDPNAAPSAMAVGDGVAWVTDRFADTVTRVDLTGLATPIAVGHLPSAIAIDAGSVWVTDSGDDAVVRIDPQTQAVTATIPVGQAPLGLAVGAGSVWVADSGEGTVMRIDPRTDKVTAKITVGGSPQQVTVSGGRAWVTVDATARPAAAAVAGGTARLVSQEDVDSLDPALAYDGLSWQLLYATCAKLLNYPDLPGPTGTVLVPEVAQSLPVRSPDGTQYVFTIRKGFRFSPPSNAAVSAQTVKDTIERALSPGMRTPQSPPTSEEFADIVGEPAFTAGKAAHISGVIAAGYTLTIRLRAPAPDLLARLAQPFFCLVPSNTPVDPRGVRLIPSAGPYYVTSYLPGQGVVLHRNPNYHGDRPHRLGRIEVTVGVSAARAISEVEAGQADYVVDKVIQDPTTAQTLAQRYGPASPAAKAGHQQYFVHPTPGLDFFTFNTHRGPFTDVRLRQAVNYAIDRTALARFGDQGLPEHPTDDYLPPGMPGAAGAHIYPLTPDLAAARRLVRGHAGQTVVLYTFAVPRGREEAQIVSGDLAAIGLRVVVKTFSPGILFAKYATPGEPFDIGLIGWTADYLDPDNFLDLVLERGTSIPGFDNPKYRAEIAAATALSGPARFLAFRRIDADLIRNGAPWAAFSNPSSHELFSARMGCQSYGAFGLDLAALCIRHPAR
jgi:peptide/nickel transport system substrate-binding protein